MSLALETVPRPERHAPFLRLPWRVYADHPLWVPPLLVELRRRLDRRRNPFWGHARAAFFLARRDGQPVGRVAAIVDEVHNERWNEACGFFGFFECLPDREAAARLLEAAAAWLRDAGCTLLRGPVSPSTNDECGLLVEGFAEPPFVLMPYHPPYYQEFLEAWGLTKAMDLLAFAFHPRDGLPPAVARAARAARERFGVTVRPLVRSRLAAELEILRRIYNEAWADNWGFVPMSALEFRFAAASLKHFVFEDLVLVAAVGGQPVGAAVCVPDLNPLLQRMNGRLLPFGWRHFLGWRRKVGAVRLLTLGVLPAHRHRGVDALLYEELLRRGRRLPLHRDCELSWVLETNRVMLRILKRCGARRTKRYRLYAAPL